MYTVIYSTDPYLLARMATDLQMGGYEKIGWPLDCYHPFTGMDSVTGGKRYVRRVAIYSGGKFHFINHRGLDIPIRHTLTSLNYLKVLGAILEGRQK